jgi:hypothetical protein
MYGRADVVSESGQREFSDRAPPPIVGSASKTVTFQPA